MADDQHPPLVRSLIAAVAAVPDDMPLRLHLAQVLLEAGQPVAALEHCSAVLRADARSAEALVLLGKIGAVLRGPSGEESASPARGEAGPTPQPADASASIDSGAPQSEDFDWFGAERQLAEGDESKVPTKGSLDPQSSLTPRGVPTPQISGPLEPAAEPLRLSDVGGMEDVKVRLQASFLVPMANPQLREQFRKSLRGGLLLYGPPGCGKTFLARALAGELGAAFHTVSLADVLDMWLGSSERNLREVFEVARSKRPAVVFFDELDALGQKRSHLRANPAMRGVVNQLLVELDGLGASNDGVFVLAATNQPWDVDEALRRPGRFDRVVFVPPPDLEARTAILRLHLAGRPVATLDYEAIARRTETFSGADLAYVCEQATESALLASSQAGALQPVSMADLERAVGDLSPSTSEWFVTARNAAQFANHNGIYDELLAYLREGKKPRRPLR